VKEGYGCYVTVDRQDFGEDVDGVDKARKEDKTEDRRSSNRPSP
jgi:hypothetical protein